MITGFSRRQETRPNALIVCGVGLSLVELLVFRCYRGGLGVVSQSWLHEREEERGRGVLATVIGANPAQLVLPITSGMAMAPPVAMCCACGGCSTTCYPVVALQTVVCF